MKKLSTILLAAAVLLCVKYLIISPTISDALIVMALVAGHCATIYLEDRKLDVNEEMKKDIEGIKSQMTAVSMSAMKKPQSGVNFKF